MTEAPPSPASGLRLEVRAELPDDPDLILVTDLDGTLLAGTLEVRRRFYAWLNDRRDRVLHVFCTGRSLDSVARQLEQDAAIGLRAPHLVICDVGCTVACGESLRPLPAALARIEAAWDGVAERLAPVLNGRPGITSQPLETTRRLAYYYDPEQVEASLVEAIEAAGADCLLSDNRYLDVLPAGVNKGSTLLDLLERLGHPHERVVTAGDTLNDYSMFRTGLRGVAVGNAEAALLERLQGRKNVYVAAGEGCAGIIEGLHHFGFGPLFG
ncbi:alpha,alpha-trehalose-phosphate synthase [Synechococcus sp. RSCCF101]|uniref:HAD family hydrolase n=1 Tax=Synechococcus sp. RSCCF101 TaxID=2511069 RepID=UPI0012484A1C|nr:HAD family hydrolase [Synechococcus sp. RSCCF101]QEY32942.1 alpha,alpha-trehalose-phosphate synthase [Synechococcus sp. RSCCF101]